MALALRIQMRRLFNICLDWYMLYVEYERVLQTFTALAEPNRLRIVDFLRAGPRPVGDIGAALGLNQPQVSKHLRVLKEAQLVEAEVRAQQRFYGLRPEPLRELNAWLGRYRRIWEERLDRLGDVVLELNAAEEKTKQQRNGKKRKR